MSMPARWLLVELFIQGERVKGARGVEYMRWGRPLEALGACANSSVFRAKNELVERGLLIEQPGARVVNNRPFSAWMVPVVLDVRDLAERLGYEDASFTEHTPISVNAPEHTPISVDALAAPESAAPYKKGAEHTPISVDAPKRAHNASRTRAQPPPSSSPAIGGVVVAKHAPISVHAPGESDSSGDHEPAEGSDSYAVAFDGLRAARVRNPASQLMQRPVNSWLGALREWVEAAEAHQADPLGHPKIWHPSGFVASRAQLEFAPVTDFGFARFWDPKGTPEKVVAFALRKGGRV